MGSIQIRKLQALAAVLFLAAVAYASATGPEPGYTGAPGDINSCVQCHDTFVQPNVGPGSAVLTGMPPLYEPGRRYDLKVTVRQDGSRRFGFQLTALDTDGDRAGALESRGDDSRLNSSTGPRGRQYLQHSESGTASVVRGSRTWQFQWTAPSEDVGPVRIFLAGNATNNDGTNQGDYIYTVAGLSESPSSNVTAELISGLDGLSLPGGSTFLIRWTTTNTANVDNFELRYSTDDGMTFPISKLILSTRDSNANSVEWSVPNLLVKKARIRLIVSTKSGAAIEKKSGRFAVAPTSQTAPLPRILGAEVDGKDLFVHGENFEDGAVVELNGEEQKTVRLEGPSSTLKCKKAGKKIPPGVEIVLRVKNPDGGRSEGFSFTKPAG